MGINTLNLSAFSEYAEKHLALYIPLSIHSIVQWILGNDRSHNLFPDRQQSRLTRGKEEMKSWMLAILATLSMLLHVHLVVDAVVDVFFDGAGKQDWFLTHDGHVGSQPLHVDVFDWFTI